MVDEKGDMGASLIDLHKTQMNGMKAEQNASQKAPAPNQQRMELAND